MLEKDLEQTFVKRVKQSGGIAYKFVSPGHTGVPDRLVILPGAHIGFVELKARGKKPRPIQVRQMEKLRKLGAVVCVLDRVEDIEGVLDEICGA